MESSWQMKCGSALQSSVPPVGSSTSREPHNQVMHPDPHFHPHFPQDPKSTLRGRMQDPLFPSTMSSSIYGSGNSDLGSSFLALLSGPPSLLQCEYQDISNLKVSHTSSKVSVNSSSLPVNAFVTETQLTSSGILPENMSNRILQNRANVCPASLPRDVGSSNCSGDSVLQSTQAANLNFQSLDLSKGVNQQVLPGIEKVKNFSLREELFGTNTGTCGKFQGTNTQALPTSSASEQLSNPMGGCPRVFCLNTSGYLLLSNIGFLGIICSCHFFHMSVSKFCEHSGVLGVNPGDVVRMETGETIAQWRKLYFQKFGIRVLEDHGGWDWPEGLSASAGLLKSRATMLSRSNGSDLAKPVASSGGSLISALPQDNIVSSKILEPGPTLVMDALCNKQQRNVQDGNNCPSEGVIGTSQSNLCGLGDNQIMECPMSRFSTASKFVGRGADMPSFAPMNSILKTGNSTMSEHTLLNLRVPSRPNDVRRVENVNNVVITETDVTSSNIELKLGQPYQQSQLSGSLSRSLIGERHLNTLIHLSKSHCLDQMIQNGGSYVEKGETSQQLYHTGRMSYHPATREVRQLNPASRPFGATNLINDSKLEKLGGDTIKSSGVPLVVTHHNMPAEGCAHSKDAGNEVNISEPVIPRILHFEPRTGKSDSVSGPPNGGTVIERQFNIPDLDFLRLIDKGAHSTKSDSVSVPLNGGTVIERQFNLPDLDFFGLMDKGNVLGCVSDDSNAVTDSALKVHKQMQNPSSLDGYMGRSIDPSFSEVQDKDYYSCQTSSVHPDAFDTRNLFNCPVKSPNPVDREHSDHIALRCMASSLGSAQTLQTPAVSVGFPSAISTSAPVLAPAFLREGSVGANSYLLDDNMRLLALRQILELSKQHHATSSLGVNQEPGKCGSSSDVKMHHSIIDISASGEQRCGPDLTSKQSVFEVIGTSLPSGVTSIAGDSNKQAPDRGFNDWYNISALTHGISLCAMEKYMSAPFAWNPFLNKQDASRLDRKENNNQSSDHENCCQRIPCMYLHGNCGCSACTKCLGGNCFSRVGSSSNCPMQQLGIVTCAPSSLAAPEFAPDSIALKESTPLLDQQAKFNEKLTNINVCHASQWKDVSSRQKRACDVEFIDQSADMLNGAARDEGKVTDPASGCLTGVAQMTDPLKEQETSNICSGSSAPAITEASVEVDNIDSSTADGGHSGYKNDVIVDEGSGIDKCWSSDDCLESEKSAELHTATCKTNRRGVSSRVFNNQSSRSLLDELKLIDSLTWRKGRNQIHSDISVHRKTNCSKVFKTHLKTGKRKKSVKLKMLDSSAPRIDLVVHDDECPKGSHTVEQLTCSSKDKRRLLPSGSETFTAGATSVQSSSELRKSTLSSAKIGCRKRNLHRIYDEQERGGDCQLGSNVDNDFQKIIAVSGRKKLVRAQKSESFGKFEIQGENHEDAERTARHSHVGSLKPSCSNQANAYNGKPRPVVCGKYGEISFEKHAENALRPIKYVSLSRILKTAPRCTLPRDYNPELTSTREFKKRRVGESYSSLDRMSSLKKEGEQKTQDTTFVHEMNLYHSVEEDNIDNKQLDDDLSSFGGEKEDQSKENFAVLGGNENTKSRPTNKETRKRSLYELAVKGANSGSETFPHMKISKCMPKMEVDKFSKIADNRKFHEQRSCKFNGKRTIPDNRCLSGTDSDAFCCVCGSSNKDEFNCLLECSLCLIKVHQACYGVSRVPKGLWCCRPCRTNSKDIVCVLCGYGGGAMTRALRSGIIVKSLLKAWNIDTECMHKNPISSTEVLQDDLAMQQFTGYSFEGDSFPTLRPANAEPSATAVRKIDLQKQLGTIWSSPSYINNWKIQNSITAGVLDPNVKQWVHMVCGLWTPGTRCPNVDTMSAFDVSGAYRPRRDVVNTGFNSLNNVYQVCSLCNRPGGSCIRCRVMYCSVHFHPWCAHQKGLLQSEVEGVDKEKVGFYGRCGLHAGHPTCKSGGNPSATKMDFLGERESTCARTEGYKGRKRDGFWHNLHGESRGKSGCFVPQEQLNAWIHINGQKSCTHGLPKLPTSIEYDCRKEYARYKQARGWKHLVVYKSGIHALGLYTSRFISRGEMVVEYVGEIVGLRVADKREIDYQSGRKLQYKSACYFFRIDKEHIIDATLKGGIARFVNHSCLPNCVAKVISVRNEKKVVFFAERDIYPGEEITYDYHFNHEDEGKKIPCFCNSKNCRRYLN